MTSKYAFQLKMCMAEVRLCRVCVCEFILLFSVVFCLVREAHKFHHIINWTPNQWNRTDAVAETSVLARTCIFSL